MSASPVVHELIQKRWSPYAFDPSKSVSTEDLIALFEAARWTMSSYNAQPWRYIVGVKERDAKQWQRIFDVLVEGNQPWAANAPVLVLGCIEHNFEYNGKPNKAALHDLGAASASLTFEATSRGLCVHQMIGIEPEKAHAEFGLGESVEAYTALAIGYLGQPEVIPEDYAKRDKKVRERKELDEIIISGSL